MAMGEVFELTRRSIIRAPRVCCRFPYYVVLFQS